MDLTLVLVGISILIGVYEVVVRAVPSVGNNSVLHFIIELLRKISDLLNRKKRR